jgi:hypothetical protein
LNVNVVAEHLAEDALQVLLHLTHVHGPERRSRALQAGDGEPVLDLGHLGLCLDVLDGAEGLPGVRVPDLLALGGEDLEEHALTNALPPAPVYDDLVSQYLRYLAFDRHAPRSLC